MMNSTLIIGNTARAAAIMFFVLLSPLTAAADTAILINTTETSAWTTPSPDPAGIAFISNANQLLVTDSEVNETPLFTGSNAYRSSLDGSLLGILSTTGYTDEPAGLAYNPTNNHLFVSTDNSPKRIYEINPGLDGTYSTADDIVTNFSTTAFGSADPEGVEYNPALNVLHVVDGVNSELYTISPGANGVFDGIAPSGDDTVTSFDTAALGITDPEGIAYDTDFGHLYIVGRPKTQVAHITTSGALVRMIDISAANAKKPAGLAYGPGSSNASVNHLYLVDRGVDNDSSPDENDGRLFEMELPAFSGDTPPSVVISAPTSGQSFVDGGSITFSATADDIEDGNLTANLSWTSSRDGVIGAGGSFSLSTLSPGSHLITSSVTDSGMNDGEDTISVTITVPGTQVFEQRIAIGTDDAEQRSTGNVWTNGNDLEITRDGTNIQTIGLRFPDVSLPPGTTILTAYIQFQADEVDSEPVAFFIEGEATDDALPITSTKFSLTNRARTSASVNWSPPAWSSVGAAGLEQRTADLAPVIQELINRPGWSFDNAILFLISGSGQRVAESYEGLASSAPLLRIEYITGNAPSVEISSPINGAAVTLGDVVSFAGSAVDVEDGVLSSDLSWNSSLDGFIGSGDSFNTSSLSLGEHLITASVTDSDGFAGSSDVTISINQAVNQPPVLVINSPDDGANFLATDSITFSASATDAEDGNLSGAVQWSSSIDGQLGAGTVSTTLSTGAHTITASVADSAGATDSDTLQLNIISPSGGNVQISKRVLAAKDDAEEVLSTGQVYLNSSDLELGFDTTGEQVVGLRFTDLAIPQGAGIVSASIQFKADETDSGLTVLTFYGQSTDDAPTFSSATGNLSSRPLTMSSTDWIPAAWDTRGLAGADERTPDIRLQIQEIVGRPGWSPGNALVMLVSGAGKRVAESYNGDAAGAALLEVTYSTSNSPPVVNAGANQSTAISSSITLAGTVSDDQLPNPPAATTNSWSLIDGPGSVTFGNSSQLTSIASFSAVGEYVLQLLSDDGELEALDQVLVTVTGSAGNGAPMVDAGPDAILSIDDVLALNGSVTDDGLPNPPAQVDTVWSQVSGPGTTLFNDPQQPATLAMFSAEGVYTLQLTGNDSELQGSDQIIVTVQNAAGTATVEARVNNSSDDAEEKASGTMRLTSSDLELADDDTSQLVGMRFTNLPVPQGSLITAAYVQFQTDETDSVGTSLIIAGQNTDNADTFLSTSGNISSRTPTVSQVNWAPLAWGTVNEAGLDQRTPDLSSIVQEIVNRPGWGAGNSIVMIVSGSGTRTAEAYNGNAAAAPLLHIEFQ